MKKIVILFFLLNFFSTPSLAILKVTKLPHDEAVIERIYKLNNGKYIFIEQFIRGHIIWEYDKSLDKFKKISNVWGFVDLASECEQISSKDIYFATTTEYWFAGGLKIDNPEIRIFELYEPNPWRNTDIGITPDMKYAREWCTFYTPYYKK